MLLPWQPSLYLHKKKHLYYAVAIFFFLIRVYVHGYSHNHTHSLSHTHSHEHKHEHQQKEITRSLRQSLVRHLSFSRKWTFCYFLQQ